MSKSTEITSIKRLTTSIKEELALKSSLRAGLPFTFDMFFKKITVQQIQNKEIENSHLFSTAKRKKAIKDTLLKKKHRDQKKAGKIEV